MGLNIYLIFGVYIFLRFFINIPQPHYHNRNCTNKLISLIFTPKPWFWCAVFLNHTATAQGSSGINPKI
jgi:hypothetical protein